MEPTANLINFCFNAGQPSGVEELDKHCFRVGLKTGKVNNTDGKLSDVSILTATEAKGHGILVDDIALAGALELLKGTRCPAFVTHSGAHWRDRMLEQVGYFEGFTIDGDQLKAATFQALNSFMEHEKPAFDRLFDVAENMPETFGVSIVFNGFLVWVSEDGTETRLGDEGKPAEGLKYHLPIVRFTEITSADFVDAPAANPNGLLEAAKKQLSNQPTNPKENEKMDTFNAEEIGKLKGLPAGFAVILGALATNPDAFKPLEENPDGIKDALAALTGETPPNPPEGNDDADLKTQLSELQNKLSALEANNEDKETVLSGLKKLLGAPPGDAPGTSPDANKDKPKGGDNELSAAQKLKGLSGRELIRQLNANKDAILQDLNK